MFYSSIYLRSQVICSDTKLPYYYLYCYYHCCYYYYHYYYYYYYYYYHYCYYQYCCCRSNIVIMIIISFSLTYEQYMNASSSILQCTQCHSNRIMIYVLTKVFSQIRTISLMISPSFFSWKHCVNSGNDNSFGKEKI